MPKNTATPAATPGARQQLGVLLRNLIQAGLDQKGDIENWWRTCEQYHRNEWMGSDDEDSDMVPIHIPYSQPRQDMLTAQVCTVVAKQDPYMLAETLDASGVSDRLEKAVHKYWKAAKFERNLRRASSICTDTNVVWWKVAWDRNDKKMFGGLLMDVMHPRHVVIYPATLEGIMGARLVGNRIYRRRRVVKALQDQGVYFNDVQVSGADSPEEHDTTGEIANSGAEATVMGSDPMDQLVEIWDVLVKYGAPIEGTDRFEPEKWYRAVIAYKQCALLIFEEYPYSRPWYFDSNYIIGSEDAYWPGVSVGRNLSGLQDATNKNSTMLYNGSAISAFPPVFGPELNEKDFRYQWGEYAPSENGQANQFFSPTINFKGDIMARENERFEEIGDRTSRVSANAQGSMQEGDHSATETSVIAAGVAVGLEEYIGNFSEPLGDMAAFTVELLDRHFDDWKVRYANKFQITPDMLKVPAQWEPNGKTPGNTPGAKLNAIQTLAGVAQQFGPASGIDPRKIVSLMIANLGLSGADGLQQDINESQNQQQQGAPPAGGPDGQPGNGPIPPSGMGTVPGMGEEPPASPYAAMLGAGPGGEPNGDIAPAGQIPGA